MQGVLDETDPLTFSKHLKGLFHPACLARVVSWFAFVDAIFMAYENGHKQRPVKRQHVQGMLDETDPLTFSKHLSLERTDQSGRLLTYRPMIPKEEKKGLRNKEQKFAAKFLDF